MRCPNACLAALLVGAIACGPPPAPSTKTTPPPSPPAEPATAASGFRVEVTAARGDGVSLEGVIRDAATGDPLAGGTVVLTSPVLAGELVFIADEDGRFVARSLQPGRYTVTMSYSELSRSTTVDVQDGKLVKLSVDWDLGSSGEIVAIEPKPVTFPNAMAALEAGAMEQAHALGQQELAKQASSRLHGMLAVAKFGLALETFSMTALRGAGDGGAVARQLRAAMATFLTDLDEVQGHLAAAARDPKFSLELCVACMASEDGHLRILPPGALDVERDRAGRELPEGDARRRPTYRFDHGDLAWGRAMVSFQQAFVNLTLAYDWDWIDRMLADTADQAADARVTVKLIEPARVARARELLLAGLAASDESRRAFLAETDDDREWVPNPSQQSYASPLAVDAALYRTWEAILGDARALVAGETGVSLAALWKVLGEQGAPAGFVDLGAMLRTPKDIVWEREALDRIEKEPSAAKRGQLTTALLKDLLGNGYKPTMKPSKITDRLLQIRTELDKGADAIVTDKLKYLLWIN